MVFSFFNNKKAQGISINVIILIVLGIAVLVVLIIIVGSKTNLFGRTLSSCEQKGAGARCISEDNEELCDGTIHRYGTDCAKRYEEGGEPLSDGPLCCVPIGGYYGE